MSVTVPEPIVRVPQRGRLIATLLAAQVCGSTGHSMTLAVGSVLAADITGANTFSGLPVAIAALGAALASLPMGRAMGRFGRRPPLAAGYGLAVIGAGLAIGSVVARSFPLLLLGMVLFGISNTSNLLARYAAADVTPAAQRGRAISLIVGGATIGSILGPNLIGLTDGPSRLLGLPVVAGGFLISVAAFCLAAAMIQTLLRPDPLALARHFQEAATSAVRPLARATRGEILRRPRVRLALGALMTAQLVMIGTTSTSPVYLRDQGHAVGTIGVAVSLHLAGMYATSPLTGWLCDRFGRLPIIATGALLLIGAVVFAALAPGGNSVLVSLALFLNGVGWNFAFVAGSALLTDALSPAERPSMQGFADLASGLMGALGSTLGGIVLGAWGFGVLNAAGAALVLIPLAGTWLRRPLLPPLGAEQSEPGASAA